MSVIKKISSSYLSKRKPPANLQEKDVKIFEKELSKQIRNSNIVSLKKTSFLSDGLLMKKRKIHPDTLTYKLIRDKLELPLWFKFKLSYKKVKGAENSIVIHNYYWNGYFHWMTEILPKLFVLKELDENLNLVLPELKAGYQQSTFEAFDFDQVLFLKEKTYIKPKSLFFVENLATSGNYNQEYICKMVDFLKRKFGLFKNGNADRKIYISRKKAPKRKVLNEDELELHLNRLGYESLCMEDFSFPEQLEICSQSKVMVSLHGAGLTNMMFMPKGGIVYEIRFENDNINNCYFTLSSEFEHSYYYQLCSSRGDFKYSHASDVVVEVNEFKHNLQRIEENL